MNSSAYRGRFAPSPTGPLHLGSLLTALASFLDARAHAGTWLVRIEDIDPPREQAGADRLILDSLRRHGLCWDEPVLYQSERGAAYEACVQQLLEQRQAFYCNCSRQDLQRSGGVHANACPRSQTPPATAAAVRLRAQDTAYRFDDLLLGSVTLPAPTGADDFVIRRRDGLYAYQLAVVVDDAHQRITHVIRGRDLLDSTPHQICLRQRLGMPPLAYGHLPLLLNEQGQKLSKQNRAPALDDRQATDNLLLCLGLLGQSLPPPAACRSCAPILEWAAQHWQRGRVPRADLRHGAVGN